MDVYLIRHTTPDVGPGVCYGRTDLKLVDSFADEARAVQNKLLAMLASQPFPVYCSPLQRCRRLADVLCMTRPIEDERLVEIDFGAWEMRRWADVDSPMFRRFRANYVHERPPGGESLLMVHQRAHEFLSDLCARPVPAVLVVSHSGVIRSLLAEPMGVPLEQAFDILLDYGSVSKLRISTPESASVHTRAEVVFEYHNR